MEEQRNEVPNPNILPEAEDGVAIDPLRLLFRGKPLFIPADTLKQGTLFLGVNADQVLKDLLHKQHPEINSHCKMVANPIVLTELVMELDARITLSPKEGDDPFYDPDVEFEEAQEVEDEGYTLGIREKFLVVGKMPLLMWRELGCKVFFVHFTEPIVNHLLRDHGHNTPVQVKICSEAGQVQGVGSFGMIVPYVGAFVVPKLFHDRIELIQSELRMCLTRVLRQAREIEYMDKSNEA